MGEGADGIVAVRAIHLGGRVYGLLLFASECIVLGGLIGRVIPGVGIHERRGGCYRLARGQGMIPTLPAGSLVNIGDRRFIVEHDRGEILVGYYCPVKDASEIKSVEIHREKIDSVAEVVA